MHASQRHALALIRIAQEQGVERIVVHALTDGRDTRPDAALAAVTELEATGVRVGTVCGRYWAMDRDRRWDRTKRAYDAMVHGFGERRASGREAVQASYDLGVTDEFIEPAVIGDPAREPDPPRRRGALLELPPRPRPPAHDGPRRARRSTASTATSPGLPAPDHDDPLQGRVPRAGAVRGAGRAPGPGRDGLGRGPPPAARGRDREVRPRHLLLQRRAARSRSRASGGCWCPRPSTSPPTTTPPR